VHQGCNIGICSSTTHALHVQLKSIRDESWASVQFSYRYWQLTSHPKFTSQCNASHQVLPRFMPVSSYQQNNIQTRSVRRHRHSCYPSPSENCTIYFHQSLNFGTLIILHWILPNSWISNILESQLSWFTASFIPGASTWHLKMFIAPTDGSIKPSALALDAIFKCSNYRHPCTFLNLWDEFLSP